MIKGINSYRDTKGVIMKQKIKMLIIALATIILAGCVSEKEQQLKIAAERAKREAAVEKARKEATAEKVRQEAAAEKARQEKQKLRLVAIDRIKGENNKNTIFDIIKNGEDEELKNVAKSRLRDISINEIATATNIIVLSILSSTEEYEKFKAYATNQVKIEKTICEKAFEPIWKGMLDYAQYPKIGHIRRKWNKEHDIVHEGKIVKAWDCIPSNIQERITVACDNFIKERREIEIDYKKRQMLDADAYQYRNKRESSLSEKMSALKETLKKQAIDSIINRGWSRKLDIVSLEYNMPEVREAAERRIRELRAEQDAIKKKQELARKDAQIAAMKAHVNNQAQLIEQYYNDLTEHNFQLMLRCLNRESASYPGDVSFNTTVNGVDLNKMVDYTLKEKWWSEKSWQRLVNCRWNLSVVVASEGMSKLEMFGTKYLPNAYQNYVKTRERAEEIQQMFNEEFPIPQQMRVNAPTWKVYLKLLHGLMKARTQFLRRHDELCHYYLMHKIGALSATELAEIDSKPINIWLLEDNRNAIDFSKSGMFVDSPVKFDEKICEFANKNAPETYGMYKRLSIQKQETQKLLDEILNDAKLIGVTRFELSIVACREKIDFLSQTMNLLVRNLLSWHMEYKLMEKDAATIYTLDGKCAAKWKVFAELMPTYLKERANGPLIAVKHPINDFYKCNLLRNWHWAALGFNLTTKFSHDISDSSVYDDLQFFENCNNGIFNCNRNETPFFDWLKLPSEKYYSLGNALNFCNRERRMRREHERVYMRRRRVGQGFINDAKRIEAPAATVREINGTEFDCDYNKSVDNGKPSILWRLNNIDAGKISYVGWNVVGKSVEYVKYLHQIKGLAVEVE